ncbi:MAG: magnesium transporter [Nanoarchaeota archaeon]|nr:magnesium transporter [Nanoarchaeota archaeon]
MQKKLKISKNIPICYSNEKISDIKKYLFDKIRDYDTIDYIYVLNKDETLEGVISSHEMFSITSDSLIKDHSIKKIVKAHKHTDPEKIAYLAINNNIKSVPIVNKKNKLIGVVKSETILHILYKENQEDFLYLEGINPEYVDKIKDLSIWKNFTLRVPWIIVGLIGGLFAAQIIGSFESVLQEELMIAAFIPLVAYIANAVGSQTQTLYIRSLAIHNEVPMLKYSIKQILISFLIAIACWIVIMIISSIIWDSQLLGVIVGLAVFCSIILATVFALLIPFILMKLDKDPAIGSGPFTTIIQDILSVLIYFYIATLLIL